MPATTSSSSFRPQQPSTLTVGTIDGAASPGSGRSAESKFQGTLDEPIRDTIMRDLKSISWKLRYVLLPKARGESGAGLRDWDLWGPLFLCLCLAVILWSQASVEQKKLIFSLVFALVWIGSGIVALNAALLGGKVSLFQSVCVLGYNLVPLDLAALVCLLLTDNLIVRIILLAGAVYWATGASSTFMALLIREDRKVLAMYPVWLFYVAIALLILLI